MFRVWVEDGNGGIDWEMSYPDEASFIGDLQVMKAIVDKFDGLISDSKYEVWFSTEEE